MRHTTFKIHEKYELLAVLHRICTDFGIRADNWVIQGISVSHKTTKLKRAEEANHRKRNETKQIDILISQHLFEWSKIIEEVKTATLTVTKGFLKQEL